MEDLFTAVLPPQLAFTGGGKTSVPRRRRLVCGELGAQAVNGKVKVKEAATKARRESRARAKAAAAAAAAPKPRAFRRAVRTGPHASTASPKTPVSSAKAMLSSTTQTA